MRVKRGLASHRRHKKYLSAAKGFRGGRSRLYRTAREAVERSMQYSYVGRKLRKRDFRTLWILRINAGARLSGLSYSRFMHGLKQAGIELNRKVLADLAVYHKDDFAKIVDLAKAALKYEWRSPRRRGTSWQRRLCPLGRMRLAGAGPCMV